MINRGNGRLRVFHSSEDYSAFLALVSRAFAKQPVRVLGFCLMPNHFHFCLWPRRDLELGRFVHYLLTAHVGYHRKTHRTTGHIWQGRFKAFPSQSGEHLLTVLRYIERNPVRAKLCKRAQDWPWSSARLWKGNRPEWLYNGPVKRPPDWLDFLRVAETDEELRALRQSVNKGTPYGEKKWVGEQAQELGLEHTTRPRGRPAKPKEDEEEEGKEGNK